jgi:hypothetical protein
MREKGSVSMSPTVVTYIGFVVAALILGWAGVELGRRYFRRRKLDARTMNSWVHFKPDSIDHAEYPMPAVDVEEDDDEEPPRKDIHTRAQQNGHHSESKKLL